MMRVRVAAGMGVVAGLAIGISRRLVRRAFEERHTARVQIGPSGIVLGAEPLHLSGSATHAVLLLHGFNDTPQSVELLAVSLNAAGWTVRAPLLPGHGRTLAAMTTGRADLWMRHVREQYAVLCATHSTVVVCGQSMGAALATILAAETPGLPALVLLAPFIGLPRDMSLQFTAAWLPQIFKPYRKSSGGERSIHDTQARARALGPGVVTARVLRELSKIAKRSEQALPAVVAPTLYLQSVEDNRVRAEDAERNFRRLGSTHRVQRWLSGCGHIITADYCRDEVARQVIEWFTRWAGTPLSDNASQTVRETSTGK